MKSKLFLSQPNLIEEKEISHNLIEPNIKLLSFKKVVATFIQKHVLFQFIDRTFAIHDVNEKDSWMNIDYSKTMRLKPPLATRGRTVVKHEESVCFKVFLMIHQI